METFYLPPLDENEEIALDMLHPTRKREPSKAFQSASWSPEEDKDRKSVV